MTSHNRDFSALTAPPDRFASPPSQDTAKLLMTLDCVGGVWRYSMDLARSLRSRGYEIIFASLGPRPSQGQASEAESIGSLHMIDEPLDWMANCEDDLRNVPHCIAQLATECHADILHLNSPSQACDIDVAIPIVAASHSCLPTWFDAMRDGNLPPEMAWQKRLQRKGFDCANGVISPSASHAAMLLDCYGDIANLRIIHNSAPPLLASTEKENFVFAAARWWDEAKNGETLDAAASAIQWPLVAAGATEGPGGETTTFKNARSKGAIPHREALKLMQQAAIVVSPSLYEPFGLVALEAARCGAALVLADIPTYRELWDGAACFANPQDPDAFSSVINLLVADAGLRNKLGQGAIERSRLFSPDAQADATSDLYRQLLTDTRQDRRLS
ncbi:glycosyltransferase family 4 protein [Rhizobium sp. L1K21]|uniref:glycosyltransferase family 4 protein n=1 Tax=Rhizobium sp. L1K21 TaxID=2954933 RepID=UPI0020920E22|nr:glycosyltransferase family 4 protein [Rhizobium sp. L1K21]MCO6187811.1 glycosyltransferase family 4 protein [Rhizobium sp. L1K21]